MLGVGLEFVLFAILGWCVFSPPANKMVLMIVFVVLMILWVVGFGASAAGWHLFK